LSTSIVRRRAGLCGFLGGFPGFRPGWPGLPGLRDADFGEDFAADFWAGFLAGFFAGRLAELPALRLPPLTGVEGTHSAWEPAKPGDRETVHVPMRRCTKNSRTADISLR
jgi:hypothetical protein